MTSSTPSSPTPAAGTDLEACLGAVELRLAALGDALRARDAQGIETHASELHRALALAVDRFAKAARAGGVPPTLRRRLAVASGHVAAQRESLARATAALDRAIDVLLPSSSGGVYGASGLADRGHTGGVIQA
jgi:hypothetical protein